MCPYRNTNLVILTSLSPCYLSRSFPLVASLRHPLKCSAVMPNGTPVHPINNLCTATEISSTSWGLSAILTVCTNMAIASPSGGRCLYRSFLSIEVCFSTSLVGGIGPPLDSR